MGRLEDWVKKMKVKRLSKKKKKADTSNSMMIARGKGRWGEVEENKRKQNGGRKRGDLGW